MTDISRVETDVEKAARYRAQLTAALNEHIVPIMNAAKSDGLKLGFGVNDNGFGWSAGPISVERPL